jgi:hypothetical protein
MSLQNYRARTSAMDISLDPFQNHAGDSAVLLHSGCARLRYIAILISTTARRTDSPDYLLIHDERNAALYRDRPGESEQTQTVPPSGHSVLERLRWSTEQCRRFRFLDG